MLQSYIFSYTTQIFVSIIFNSKSLENVCFQGFLSVYTEGGIFCLLQTRGRYS